MLCETETRQGMAFVGGLAQGYLSLSWWLGHSNYSGVGGVKASHWGGFCSTGIWKWGVCRNKNGQMTAVVHFLEFSTRFPAEKSLVQISSRITVLIHFEHLPESNIKLYWWIIIQLGEFPLISRPIRRTLENNIGFTMFLFFPFNIYGNLYYAFL